MKSYLGERQASSRGVNTWHSGAGERFLLLALHVCAKLGFVVPLDGHPSKTQAVAPAALGVGQRGDRDFFSRPGFCPPLLFQRPLSFSIKRSPGEQPKYKQSRQSVFRLICLAVPRTSAESVWRDTPVSRARRDMFKILFSPISRPRVTWMRVFWLFFFPEPGRLFVASVGILPPFSLQVALSGGPLVLDLYLRYLA